MRPAAIACFLLLVISPPALAHSISMNPRPTALLRSGQFVAQDGFNSVTLYDPSGKPLARFDGGGYVWAIDVSPDERYVAVACTPGPLLLGDLHTGATVWSKGAAEIGVRYARSVSFAADGRSLVVCDDADQAVLVETAGGRPIRSIKIVDSNFVSAALAPDGSTGALVELGGHVFTFDVASGAMRDTGQTGAWPIRFTADGKYIALGSTHSGQGEKLRVITAADPSQARDLGQFSQIGRIQPLPDGTLLVTAAVGTVYTGRVKTVGVRCDPAAGTITPLWDAGPRPAEFETAFDPETLLGVSTDYRLVTSLIDLRAGAVRLTIDHSAEFDRRMRETDPVRDWGRTTGEVATTIAAILLLALIVRRLRKPPPPG